MFLPNGNTDFDEICGIDAVILGNQLISFCNQLVHNSGSNFKADVI